MRYAGIGNYLEQTFGVTEFYMHNARIVKTTAGLWLPIKD